MAAAPPFRADGAVRNRMGGRSAVAAGSVSFEPAHGGDGGGSGGGGNHCDLTPKLANSIVVAGPARPRLDRNEEVSDEKEETRGPM